MITCTVHERDGGGGSVTARAEGIVFVREGVAWWALLFPILWLLYHRLWLVLAGFVALLASLSALARMADVPDLVAGIVSFGLGLLMALEGNDLRRWKLARRGYRLVDVTTGRDQGECEQRFFDGWLVAQDARGGPAPRAALASIPAAPRGGGEGGDDVIGLFPDAGR